MDALLLKIFATALTLSQVTTAPDAVKTTFDRVADQPQVVRLLQAGCAHMRKAFDIEDINIDDLISTAMEDPAGFTAGAAPTFRGMTISFNDLHSAYKQFCKNEVVEKSVIDLGELIDFYNHAIADLPDHGKLKNLRLPGATTVLDRKGAPFAEVFEQNQRRTVVKLADIPMHVVRAFVSAEDKRFFEHSGIDERGLIRAFIGTLSGKVQGGSTITQQVVKNLLVGDDQSLERKMREMIVAARLERALSKNEILELYLNSIYLGRGSWGIEMAARSYFGKPASALTVSEGALLAGLTKGPNYYNPDRHPARAQERLTYVLGRLQEDGVISADTAKAAIGAGAPMLVVMDRPRRDFGYHFADHISREAKADARIDALTGDSYTVRSTIIPELQRATETALQDGLARFEAEGNRAQFQGPEANLGEIIGRIETEARTAPRPASPSAVRPAWRRALENTRLPLYDVHWPAGVIIEKTAVRGGGETLKVGLADGRILPLTVGRPAIQRTLKLHDVVFVRVTETRGGGKAAAAARAELRIRPTVQGSAVVIENKTGRILAMTGGFSYPLSQLNRVTQSQRQPGSALKPLTYLAALQKGIQPNTLVRDETITLPPLAPGRTRDEDYWSPKNYDGGSGGIITLRRALENSKNLATVNLLDGGIDITPALSLDRICALAIEAQVYRECIRYYPFVLGAQPVRPIDIAGFYAAIANEGVRPAVHAIESIEKNGIVVYRHPATAGSIMGSADKASFYQLKSMMQGVLQRGTANKFAHLAPYVAGKTGTTDGENDAWFVGFTNEVTIAVWVGYDNADGRRRTLGGGQTGASVAVPIFEPIVQAAWTYHSPRTVLAPPSAEARRDLVAVRSDGTDDEFAGGRGRAAASAGMTEYLRRDRSGRAPDSRYMLVSRGEGEGGIDGRGRDPFGRDRDPFGRDLPAREPETRPIWGSPWGTRDREPSGGGFFSFPQRTVEPRGRTRGPWD